MRRPTISTRADNCLVFAGITDFDKLANMTEAEVLNIHNLGRKSFNEIKEYLKGRGLAMKPSVFDEVSHPRRAVYARPGASVYLYLEELEEIRPMLSGKSLERIDVAIKYAKHVGR